jgi:hypothetical protein
MILSRTAALEFLVSEAIGVRLFVEKAVVLPRPALHYVELLQLESVVRSRIVERVAAGSTVFQMRSPVTTLRYA